MKLSFSIFIAPNSFFQIEAQEKFVILVRRGIVKSLAFSPPTQIGFLHSVPEIPAIRFVEECLN